MGRNESVPIGFFYKNPNNEAGSKFMKAGVKLGNNSEMPILKLEPPDDSGELKINRIDEPRKPIRTAKDIGVGLEILDSILENHFLRFLSYFQMKERMVAPLNQDQEECFKKKIRDRLPITYQEVGIDKPGLDSKTQKVLKKLVDRFNEFNSRIKL